MALHGRDNHEDLVSSELPVPVLRLILYRTRVGSAQKPIHQFVRNKVLAFLVSHRHQNIEVHQLEELLKTILFGRSSFMHCNAIFFFYLM